MSSSLPPSAASSRRLLQAMPTGDFPEAPFVSPLRTVMFSSRVGFSLVALASVSLLGDFICGGRAYFGESEKLMKVAGERVARLPERIGSWQAEEDEPLSTTVLEMLSCKAHQVRIYTDSETREMVSLILLVGPSG